MSQKKTCVLAFSGGLDTSYCTALLTERGYEVITVTVDTGGFNDEELAEIEARAAEVGAVKHETIRAERTFFDEVLTHLIRGNCLRGQVYPLCVASERVLQAMELCRYANRVGADAVCHGSTGAGNDQMRFDVAAAVLAPDCQLITPVRDEQVERAASAAWLRERGVEVEESTATYSINQGLWGTTIGGGETHDPWAEVPEEAYVTTVAPSAAPDEPEDLVVGFEQGVPVSLNGETLDPVELVRAIAARGAAHGVGRAIHVGTTVLGIKGRIAFEAPAPAILVPAHRELEKIVQTREQQVMSRSIGARYADLMHAGRFLDPVMRDLEAFLASAQRRVTGEARVRLYKGSASVIGTRSAYSLLGRGARYGESATGFSGPEAAGFCKVSAIELAVAAKAERGA